MYGTVNPCFYERPQLSLLTYGASEDYYKILIIFGLNPENGISNDPYGQYSALKITDKKSYKKNKWSNGYRDGFKPVPENVCGYKICSHKYKSEEIMKTEAFALKQYNIAYTYEKAEQTKGHGKKPGR